MARKQHDYHYIYRTTCKVTGNFYVGMHSTSNLEDDYLGSGIRLWRSIRKHGKENHFREILEFCENRTSLKDREREIVNEKFLEDPKCMNLKPGGHGGFCNEEHQLKCSLAGSKVGPKKVSKFWKSEGNETLKEEIRAKLSTSIKIGVIKRGKWNDWNIGNNLSDDHKSKIGNKTSVSQKGNKNSQYGTCWIKHENGDCKKIKKEDLNFYIQMGYERGRTDSFNHKRTDHTIQKNEIVK